MLRLDEAIQSASGLAGLNARCMEAQSYLDHVLPMIPFALRACVQAGPVENGVWCLLVQNGTAAAKLRQLEPSLITSLKKKHPTISHLRIKVVKS